jgi:hypothetical protein
MAIVGLSQEVAYTLGFLFGGEAAKMLCKVRHGLPAPMPIALAETRTGRPGAFIRRAADLLTTADSLMSRLPFSFEYIRIAKAAGKSIFY